MMYAHEDRLDAVNDALRHNLSVLGLFFKKTGIEQLKISFEASNGSVLFGQMGMATRSEVDNADPFEEVLSEMIDGLQDVRATEDGVERVSMLPLTLEAAVRDACTYAADLRLDDWKDNAKGSVKFWWERSITLARPPWRRRRVSRSPGRTASRGAESLRRVKERRFMSVERANG